MTENFEKSRSDRRVFIAVQLRFEISKCSFEGEKYTNILLSVIFMSEFFNMPPETMFIFILLNSVALFALFKCVTICNNYIVTECYDKVKGRLMKVFSAEYLKSAGNRLR